MPVHSPILEFEARASHGTKIHPRKLEVLVAFVGIGTFKVVNFVLLQAHIHFVTIFT